MYLTRPQLERKELSGDIYDTVHTLADFWYWWDTDDFADMSLGEHNAMKPARNLARTSLPEDLRSDHNIDIVVAGTRAITMGDSHYNPEHEEGFNRALLYFAIDRAELARRNAVEELGQMAIYEGSIDDLVNLAEFVTLQAPKET